MTDYETERQENIKRNKALIQSLGLANISAETASKPAKRPPPKKRKLNNTTPAAGPTRSSARIASALKASYTSPSPPPSSISTRSRSKSSKSSKPSTSTAATSPSPPPPSSPPQSLSSLITSWSSWTPSAPPPSRDTSGTFHFPSHPSFTPNKAPSEILSEGCFGGTYFRPLYSTTLHTTISSDYTSTVPASWYSHLNISKYLTSPTYDPEVNKYHVACGQSIEEWEKAGWIRHEFDARGWFEWYCRFFQGRRCGDDERQVGRWERCVGPKGRWRRVLVKRYLGKGVRSVADEGEEDEEEVQGRGLSPVVHQTCFHWGWELRQEELDRVWAERDGGGGG